MTRDEIERGLRDLGLADDVIRRSLQRLAELAPSPPKAIYETMTAAHTSDETTRSIDARLEPGS